MKFSDFALEFYSFVADNYAHFYSTPIECTDRDAAFVLDGLLYNESDLELEEHYTDTHGYTEINFAAFAMLGRRFCPRIRGLQDQRIYRIDSDGDYGALASLVSRADRTIDAQVITEQWDRMGQFYASLASGHTTASVALRRLAAYSPKTGSTVPTGSWVGFSRPSSFSTTCRSRNCGHGFDVGCLKWNSCTRWPGTFTTGEEGGSTLGSSTSR
jgi:TnpA family transposase